MEKNIKVTFTKENAISVYKFDYLPPLSEIIANKTDIEHIQIDPSEYLYRSYYFLQKSSVAHFWNSSENIDFFIIQGTTDFKYWKEDHTTFSNFLYKSFGQEEFNTLQIIQSDTYYFVWQNPYPLQISGVIIFNLHLTTYDYAHPSASCERQLSCNFDFSRSGSQYILFVAEDFGNPGDVVTVDWTIGPRLDYYWSIFGSLLAVWFVAFVIIVAVFLYFKYHEGKRARPMNESPLEDSD